MSAFVHAGTMMYTCHHETCQVWCGALTAEMRYREASLWDKARSLCCAPGVLREGETRYMSGATPTDYRYTSQREDASVGLYFYNARWYDPSIGRFAQADTIVPGGVQGLDRYAYVNNNPLYYTDPDGHFAIPAAVIVGMIVLTKAIDYGWTAYDAWQSTKVLNDPTATDAAKALAATNLAMIAAFEAAEPDDVLPIGLPLDDLARHGVLKLGDEAVEHGDEIGEFIYRKASGSPDSLTPRPGLDDLSLENGGLSFFNSVDNMISNMTFKPGDKYVVVDPKKLDGLEVILDNTPPGHVSVRPPTLELLQDWASTWKTGTVHKFTEIVKNAIVGNPVKWK